MAYMVENVGPDAIREGQCIVLVLIAVLGFLIWSVGLALSRLFHR